METAEDDRERFQTIPTLPEGVEVTDRVKDLYDTLREKHDLRPAGAERDEYARAIRALVDQVKGVQAKAEPDFIESPINSTTQFTDKRGRAAIRERDSLGNERVVTLSREETKAYEDALREKINMREQANVLRDQVKRIRALAFAAADTGSSSAAEQLHAQADEKSKQATAVLDQLREQVPPENWKEYDLGPAPEPLLPGVEEALAALHAGRTDEVFEMTRDFGQAETYQLFQRAPAEDRGFLDILTKKAGDEENSRRLGVGF